MRRLSLGISLDQDAVLLDIRQRYGHTIAQIVEAALGYWLPHRYGIDWPPFERHANAPANRARWRESHVTRHLRMLAVNLSAEQWSALYEALAQEGDGRGEQTVLVEEALAAYIPLAYRDATGDPLTFPLHVRQAREGARAAFWESH